MAERLCVRCSNHFSVGRHNAAQVYCPSCATALRTRVCEWCGRTFPVRDPAQRNRFCSPACAGKGSPKQNRGRARTLPDRTCEWCGKVFRPRAQGQRFCCRAHSLEAQRDAGRTSVRCVWPQCPRPDDLISLIRSRAERTDDHAYHPECWQAYLRAGRPGAHRRTGKGAVICCQICGEEIGYRPASSQQKYHLECYLAAKRRTERGHIGVTRPCAHCGTPVFRAGRHARSEHFFCTRAHMDAWFAEQGPAFFTGRAVPRVIVRCTACRQTRAYREKGLPATVERDTMTWVCPACRVRSTVRTLTCTYCGVDFPGRVAADDRRKRRFCTHEHLTMWLHEQRQTVKVRCAQCCREVQRGERSKDRVIVEIPRRRYHPDRPHFCTRRHAGLYRRIREDRMTPCEQCGQLFERTGGHTKFCDRACYAAWKRGRPQVPSAAERKVLAAYDRGVRGVSKLAKEAGVAENTVRNLQKRGDLPDARLT